MGGAGSPLRGRGGAGPTLQGMRGHELPAEQGERQSAPWDWEDVVAQLCLRVESECPSDRLAVPAVRPHACAPCPEGLSGQHGDLAFK